MGSRDLPPKGDNQRDEDILALARELAEELNLREPLEPGRDYFEELTQFCLRRGLPSPTFIYKKDGEKAECTVTIQFPGFPAFSHKERDLNAKASRQRASMIILKKLQKEIHSN